MHHQVVSSNTSLVDWRAVHEGISSQWHGPWLAQHINLLELQAINLAPLHFLPELRNHHVLVRRDGTVVVAYKQASPRFFRLAWLIWEWTRSQFKSLNAMHVPGQVNLAMDQLSGVGGPLPEWRLHPEVVSKIWDCFGTAIADLFASMEAAHCPLFFSIGRDNPTLGTDAMAHQWP